MAKITEYPEALSFDAGDVILKDGTNGTKKMTAETLKSLIAPVDNTLSQTGKAADAKSVGDAVKETKDYVEAVIDGTFEATTIDLTQYASASCFISTSTGKWQAETGDECWIAPIDTDSKFVTVAASASKPAMVAFLTSNSHTTGNDPSYVTGESLVTIEASSTKRLQIPSTATYIYIAKASNSNTYTPSSFKFESPAVDPVDTTLTQEGKPADAKVVGDKIGRIDGEIFYEIPFDPDSSNVSAFIGSANKWINIASDRKCGIAPIPEGTVKIAVQANADNVTNIAILASSAHTVSTTPDYATGWSERVQLGAGQTAEYEVPADGKYLYYDRQYGDEIRTLQSIMYYTGWLRVAKAQVKDNTTILSPVNLAKNAPLFTKAIDAATGEEITSSLSHIDYIDVSEYDNILYSRLWSTSTPSQITSGMAFYDEEKSYISGLKNQANAPEMSSNMYFIHVPENAKYARFTWSASSGEFLLYDAEQYYNSVTTRLSTVALQLGLHETPLDVNKLNIVKRARQMTDIKWTPAADLPRYMKVSTGGAEIPDTASVQNYLGTFKAGVEYKGLPYGRVTQTMKTGYNYSYATVGRYIDFETFISSVSNPKSALCQRDVGNVGDHRSVIYATVCSGLTCYALGVSEVATASIGAISGLTTVGKLNDSSTLLPDYAIRVGDVLNLAGYHTAIITDIIRGDDGTIRFVEISEATTKGLADRNYDEGQAGGLCIRRGWTREQLYDSGIWGEYSVLRYEKTVPYTPNAYAPIAGELDAYRIEQFPIMPYEGEGFAFKTGYVPDNAVKLVITLGGYDYVKVFKDGVEVTGSPFAVTTDAQTNEINDVSVSEIGEGSYTAYLCNIADGNVTNLTYACHWSVGGATRAIEEVPETEENR